MMARVFLAACAAAVMVAGAAKAGERITYEGTYVPVSDAGAPDVYFTVVTDGKTGALAQNDILAFTVSNSTFTDGSFTNETGSVGFFDYSTDPDGVSGEDDGGLAASATALTFNPSSQGAVVFQGSSDLPPFMDLTDYFCIGDGGMNCNFVANYRGLDGFAGYEVESATSVVATETSAVSAAPEATTWALLIAGAGVIGSKLRSVRRRALIA